MDKICLVSVLFVAYSTHFITNFGVSQSTESDTGCTIYDDSNVYNIQVMKGSKSTPCTSVHSLNEKQKVTEAKTMEVAYEVMQLQAMVLRLMEQNQNLTKQVQQLKGDINILKKAMNIHKSALDRCPPGYTVLQEEFKACYMFVERELSWYDAEAFCMSTQAHLVGLDTEEEQHLIVNYIKKHAVLSDNHIWTGGNDIAKEDDWIWAGTNQRFNYTLWMSYPQEEGDPVEMPDNHNNQEHCVQLFYLHNYAWNDIYCGYHYYFICEYKLQ